MTAAAFVDAVGWTLVNSTWQAALIAGATALHLAILRNARPETRYAMACTGLLLCLLWPAAALCLRLNGGGADAGGVAVMLTGSAGKPSEIGWNGLFQLNLAWIVGAWALCALLLALRMAAGVLWVRRAAAQEARDPAWQARLDRLATQFDLGRAVRLRLVANLASPVTAGWWRPVVLVPASLVTTMPAPLLEALLAHELAHIRRHDYLVNLLQNMVEALLFFHPAVWWLSRRIRHERELIADDIAARMLGEPRRLALALSELEKLQFSTPQHLAQAANGGDLMSRIKQLVRPEPQALNWKAAIPVLGFALAGLVGCAQQPQAEPVTVIANKILPSPVVDFDSCSKPVYPAEALARKVEGTVSLAYLVGSDGQVRQSRVVASSGDASLDEAARAAIGKCRFTPSVDAGKPVEAWAAVKYVWQV